MTSTSNPKPDFLNQPINDRMAKMLLHVVPSLCLRIRVAEHRHVAPWEAGIFGALAGSHMMGMPIPDADDLRALVILSHSMPPEMNEEQANQRRFQMQTLLDAYGKMIEDGVKDWMAANPRKEAPCNMH